MKHTNPFESMKRKGSEDEGRPDAGAAFSKMLKGAESKLDAVKRSDPFEKDTDEDEEGTPCTCGCKHCCEGKENESDEQEPEDDDEGY